jgi:hypothetical protein
VVAIAPTVGVASLIAARVFPPAASAVAVGVTTAAATVVTQRCLVSILVLVLI